jgi:hypothetical protein
VVDFERNNIQYDPHTGILESSVVCLNLRTVLTLVKYIGCFQDTDTRYNPARLYNYSIKKCLHFNYPTLKPSQLCMKVDDVVLYDIALS